MSADTHVAWLASIVPYPALVNMSGDTNIDKPGRDAAVAAIRYQERVHGAIPHHVQVAACASVFTPEELLVEARRLRHGPLYNALTDAMRAKGAARDMRTSAALSETVGRDLGHYSGPGPSGI